MADHWNRVGRSRQVQIQWSGQLIQQPYGEDRHVILTGVVAEHVLQYPVTKLLDPARRLP